MINLAISASQLDEALNVDERYKVCKSMAAGYANSIKTDDKRLDQARLFCHEIVSSFWTQICTYNKVKLDIKQAPHFRRGLTLPVDAKRLAIETGKIIAAFPAQDVPFLVGSIYTAMMPTQLRSQMGAYYTPPPLVDRLLELAESAGFNFTKSSLIDPSCGGGAFLVAAAIRLWEANRNSNSKFIFKKVSTQLKGIELDPFSAWIARVTLESALLPLCISANSRLPDDIVVTGDALTTSNLGSFDLIIGNPPYGRVVLSKELRTKYERSLYGHANLYGIFTDLALRIVKHNGIIAYLTPTSFLGGKYFMNLRHLITSQTTPVAFDFITDRDGVFEDVLQETMLTVFKVGQLSSIASVSTLTPKKMHSTKVERIGTVQIPVGAQPWMIPRTTQDREILSAIQHMPTRLKDLGYSVSTGQLVWNRFKPQLKTKLTASSLPLIWAESVTNSGFRFSAEKRNHLPFFEVRKIQKFLVTSKTCILVQRTTSIEQNRRLIAAVLPQDFIDEHNGVVVENHLNMVVAEDSAALIPLTVVEALLNSYTLDQVFRCISGSVAVSAYELNNLPLPNVTQLNSLANSIKKGASKEYIEKRIASFYKDN